MSSYISLTELYSMKENKERKKIEYYNTILAKCHDKIRNTAKLGGTNIFYEIPYFIFGLPLYDMGLCISYIVNSLRNNGLFVQILQKPNDNMLYISWSPNDVKMKKPATNYLENRSNVFGI